MREINTPVTILVTMLLLVMTVGTGAADENATIELQEEEGLVVNLQEGDVLLKGETHGLMFNPIEALPQNPMILVGIIPEGETIGRWQVLTECELGTFMLDIHEDTPTGECKILIFVFEKSPLCGLFVCEKLSPIANITIVDPYYVVEP